MNDVRNILHGFWSDFKNPLNSQFLMAFQNGYAIVRDSQGRPERPLFPYITYDLELPDTLDFTISSASVWDRRPSSPGFFGVVDDVLRQARERIPTQGIVLDIQDGQAVWIYRSNPFIQYLDDPDDQAIMRGIVRVTVRYYGS